jgi:hypothetical protein
VARTRATLAPGTLQRVERELERIGLLLEHDAALPSVTLLCAGEPIRGSWWGHPLGHAIYDLLHELNERSGQLDAKLVNGKVTYVHARLWPAFFALAEQRTEARIEGLDSLAKTLLARTEPGAALRLDHLQQEGTAPGKALTAAARVLEARVLVWSGSVHADAGAHARVLQSWPGWRRDHDVEASALQPRSAHEALAAAGVELARDAARPAKLAL